MEFKGSRICLGFSVILLWHMLGNTAQPGFLSIDCGAKTNHRDGNNIEWVTDNNYIDVGEMRDINNPTLPYHQQSLRVFPQPLNKSCYQLPIAPNVPHLFRFSFVGSKLSRSVTFNYSIQAIDMLYSKELEFNATKFSIIGEKILYTSGEVVYICLIRTSSNIDPFISAIELRKLKKGMYRMAKPGTMLHLEARWDMGGQSIIRYPYDQFDRMWFPSDPIKRTVTVNSEKRISVNNTEDLPPTTVMETADTIPDNIEGNIDFFIGPYPTSSLLLMYLAEVERSGSLEARILDAAIDNEVTDGNVIIPRNFSAVELPFQITKPTIIFSLRKAVNSSRGPIVNAYEYYRLILTENATFLKDVQALTEVKRRFGMKDWRSDPCFGVPWDGIHCVTRSSALRVSAINLTGRHLTGSIPKTLGQLSELVNLSLAYNSLTGPLQNLSTLRKLERLHLQNNNLSGKVPIWLSQLPNLKELFIGNNNFSGDVPLQLYSKTLSGFHFTYTGGNQFLRIPKLNSTSPSYSKLVVGLIIAGGIAIITFILFLIIIIYRKKVMRKKTVHTGICNVTGNKGFIFDNGEEYSMVMVPNPSKSRAFTLNEMLAATENFSHRIGHGGFGSVFRGRLQEGQEIAVKMLSSFSKQGVAEFLNEIDLLSRIHHKNLVSLLGYCNESRDLMLVYEYMPGGSLKEHLYGTNEEKHPKLDWKSRLKIALHSAQGLEYLHVACTPRIIHRDIKTGNILLDANLNGKLADFGLSRITIEGEASHVTTTVKGTAGYLDPEYFSTQMLTEKSDIYSFGVVLLELICGRRPIDAKLSEEEINIIRWVTPYVDVAEDSGKVAEIVDKKLGNLYDPKSIVHIAKLAIRCVGTEPSSRPSASEIVAGIKEALQYDDANSLGVSQEFSEEYGDRHSIQVSISDSSGPKETGSTENSSNIPGEGR